MNKHYLLSSLVLLTLLTSCNKNGVKLCIDDEEDFNTISTGLDPKLRAAYLEPYQKACDEATKNLRLSKAKALLFAQTAIEKMSEGKSTEWAYAYARVIIDGLPPLIAETYAEGNNYSEVHWKAYKRALKNKNTTYAKTYANTYVKALADPQITGDDQADNRAKACARAVAQGNDYPWAVRFAKAKVGAGGKSNSWCTVYADAMTVIPNHTRATRLADLCMRLREELKMPKNQAYNEAMRIINANGQFNINYQDAHGDTYLIRAVRADNAAWARQLVEGGADATLENNDGQTAFDVAAGNPSMRALLSAQH